MDTSFKKSLKSQAHHLKPVIILGAKGLTDAVIAETNIALLAHELIKIKMNNTEKADRMSLATELCQQLKAEFIQIIGNTLIIFRKNEEKHK
jgi:RNA-binding protein